MKSQRFWIGMMVAGFALFGLSFALRPLDAPVGQAVAGAPALVLIAGGFAFLGGITFVAPALLLGTGALVYLRRWWGAVRVAGATLLSEAVTRATKLLVARPRPEYMLVETGGFSFPSGHATIGAATAVLLVWFAGRYVRGRWLVTALLALALLWAVAMAASRLVLGVHYPSDVVAGMGVGMACSSGVILATMRLERHADRARADVTTGNP